ncbi:MAG: DUF3015 domain-containing protein, partial [Gammaproteobacteria bacterium]|nr:DUF3015 domain-containing protein [Gammaproteobacteria bacterium]
SNRDSLSVDMAQGQGDYLESLAVIMKITEQDRDSFYKLTQQNYESIALDSGVEAQQMLSALDEVLRKDNTLSVYIQ